MKDPFHITTLIVVYTDMGIRKEQVSSLLVSRGGVLQDKMGSTSIDYDIKDGCLRVFEIGGEEPWSAWLIPLSRLITLAVNGTIIEEQEAPPVEPIEEASGRATPTPSLYNDQGPHPMFPHPQPNQGKSTRTVLEEGLNEGVDFSQGPHPHDEHTTAVSAAKRFFEAPPGTLRISSGGPGGVMGVGWVRILKALVYYAGEAEALVPTKIDWQQACGSCGSLPETPAMERALHRVSGGVGPRVPEALAKAEEEEHTRAKLSDTQGMARCHIPTREQLEKIENDFGDRRKGENA